MAGCFHVASCCRCVSPAFHSKAVDPKTSQASLGDPARTPAKPEAPEGKSTWSSLSKVEIPGSILGALFHRTGFVLP